MTAPLSKVRPSLCQLHPPKSHMRIDVSCPYHLSGGLSRSLGWIASLRPQFRLWMKGDCGLLISSLDNFSSPRPSNPQSSPSCSSTMINPLPAVQIAEPEPVA